MKKSWCAGLVAFLLALGYTGVPGSVSGQQRHPFSLWPASDAGFDLGIAGSKETPFRWRTLFVASSVIIRATSAGVEAGELVFAGREQPSTPVGSGYLKIFIKPGSNAGTCQLVAMAGSSRTETVIVDNVGGGGCGQK